MQVFRAYFKVIKKNLPAMSAYFVAFLFFVIMMSMSGMTKTFEDFNATKCRIAFINQDEDSALARGLEEYLKENAQIVEIVDDRQSMQDALFFRHVEYIVKVPEGFTQAFYNGESGAHGLIQKTVVPASTTSVAVDLLINQYLNTAKLYLDSLGLQDQALVQQVKENLALKAAVQMKKYGNRTAPGNVQYYFVFIAYACMATTILAVTSIMFVFNQTDLRKRNLCSPIKLSHYNRQLILGSFVYLLASWGLSMLTSIVIYGPDIVNGTYWLWGANLLVFAIACMSISFLVGNLIRSKNAQSAIANVLSLGLGFISGVFVPQVMLGEFVLTIASFNPTYWYIKAVNEIRDLSVFSAENIWPIGQSMLIQLGFAVAALTIALAISKHKRLSSE